MTADAPERNARRIRIPMTDSDIERLAGMLRTVPVETTIRFSWCSPPGVAFIQEVQSLQLAGTPLRWIADELHITVAALDGAISYHNRKKRRRNSRPATARET